MCGHDEGRDYLRSALRKRCTETIVTESIIMGFLTAAGFVSSSLMCLTIFRNAKFRCAIHMYLLSYAMIDLLKSTLVMPFTFGVILKGEWISSGSVCQFQGYIVSVLDIATVFTMMLAAVDRYMANIHLAQYLTLFKRKHVYGALTVSWLISLAVPLSFAISGNDIYLHPGYGICREEVTNATYLKASILKIIFSVLPFITIAACFYGARVNMRRTYQSAKLRAKEGRMVNTNTWREQEATTRLFAALILGTVGFWVPSYICEMVDAFTHEYCLPRSVYFVSTLIANASCFTKPLIIASMNEEFLIEFKRMLKLRKSRRIVAFDQAGNEELDTRQKPIERRNKKYRCELKIPDDDVINRTESSA